MGNLTHEKKYIVAHYSPFHNRLTMRSVTAKTARDACIKAAKQDGWTIESYEQLISGEIEDLYTADVADWIF